MRHRFRIVMLAVVAGAATVALPASAVGSGVAAQAAGPYVVELRDGSDGRAVAAELGVTPRHVYADAIDGFAGDFTTEQLAKLQQRTDLLSFSPDERRTDVFDTTQPNPPSWGIDRVDQRFLPLSANYTYWYGGTTVRVYVIDSGIDTAHADFGGRAQFMHNSIDANNTDCNGHGTHVAGTVGSATYGVAKTVKLRAVKAIDCGGGSSLGALVNAVDWVKANAIEPAVVNTSWKWPANLILENALNSMISSGKYLATSAGNTGGNDCAKLPRKIPAAMAVAATTSTDARAAYSSVGPCVDIYAPGSGIRSTLPGGGNGLKDGTSMATPHVAGIAALYKDAYGEASQATVNNWITGCSTPNVVTGALVGTPNRLANTCGL